MPQPFKEHIKTALANPNLQWALDANSERRLIANQQAFASLPEDLQTLRQRAHAVRAEVVEHMDSYLEQFIQKAEANGLQVHRAADAAEAVSLVLEIARQNHARLIAKSKTMLSEEIHLNRALEVAGLKVVETDLGEFIVQLRGEAPGHIITPAVHLRRIDVGQTFHEKLGLPLTDDVPTMTTAARRILRQTFLDADIGISGVNLGVVETGTLCLLTNEGNGRMVTTLPPVHIALMGIERMVPTLDDLALILTLLPRSSTGQKLTVYTSLIHGPRRPGDPDGPRERHLILVDNGRSAVRESPLAEALLCIRCGACLNACPVFREIGGHAYVGAHGQASTYSGPIGSVLSPALFGQSEFANLARASTLCGACREACPVDIDLPKLLLRVRAGGSQMQSPLSPAAGDRRIPARQPGEAARRVPGNVPRSLAWGLKGYTWIVASPARFALAQKLAGLFGRLAAPSSGWLRLPAFTSWGLSKDFPRPAARSFRERWKDHNPSTSPTVVTNHDPLSPIPFSPHPPVSAAPPLPSTPAPLPPLTLALQVRFSSELADLGGALTACTQEQLPGQILELLSSRGLTSLLAWGSDFLPAGLLEALEQAGILLKQEPDPTVKAGLTGALAGIADTGTLVLPGGPGRPLTASLLPELHIAVLKKEDIYENLARVLALDEVRRASAAVLITGPSRTADIEMTLTIGVHGPGEVQVFCI